MRIGFLLPTLLSSDAYSHDRIFAPLYAALPLVNKLVQKGHEVRFYTSADVQKKTSATVISGDQKLTNTKPTYYQYRYRDEAEKKYTTLEIIKRDFEYDLTLKAYQDATAGKIDIIHSYHDFGAHYFDELTHFPTVYTLHDPLPQHQDTVEFQRLSKFLHHNYVSISDNQRKSVLSLNFIDTIYHGLDVEQFKYNAHPDNYYVYFGRMIEDKGIDVAIQLALKTNNKLYIATSLTPANVAGEYYEKKIKPFIDGEQIKLIGFLDHDAKVELIKKAKAFIFPLQWEEPFGLTVIESMACGTPVITYNRGSMSELVKDTVTGYVVDPNKGIDGMIEAINQINNIDRSACRKRVEDLFTVDVMTQSYEECYSKILA